MSASTAVLDRVHRDLGSEELWRRSLERSQRRRARSPGATAARSLVSAALADLDGPLPLRPLPSERDLSDPELWDFSAAVARAKRLAAEPGFLPQARVAGATLVVAAVAAALPSPGGGAGSRARGSGTTQAQVELLRYGSRGPAVARVQRALGIPADGIFGPQTRRAVRGFQERHGLLADGVVGPRTRGALFRERGAPDAGYLRAWWVVPVQRALGVPADGLYGPVSRAAVRTFQKERGLVVDGVVGPQTLGALGIRRGQPAAGKGGAARPERRDSRPRYVRGWWVVPVQRALGVPADGLYGPVSRAAVRAFQKERGLVVDGVVGPQTLGALGIRQGQPAGGNGGRNGGGRERAAPASTRGERAVRIARRYLGVPYRWGGASPSTGFDCSGFVMYVYARLGVSLPHNAAMQYGHGRAVSRGSLRPGDLVFFSGLGHNGIYVGGGRFIHSPSTGDVVKISSLREGWYGDRWVGARRV